MNIALWLQRTAVNKSDAPALFLGAEAQQTYGEWFDLACRFSGWLAGQGIGPGDRVVIFMRNQPAYLIAKWGIWCAGAVAVPVNARLHLGVPAMVLP